MSKARILIFGVTGMLGHTLFKKMSTNCNLDVFGTTRNATGLSRYFSTDELNRIRDLVDADNFDSIMRVVSSIQPDIIINCIGLIKQLPIAKDPLAAITINAQLPHRLSMLASLVKARMIHISTDCVFSGTKGNYTENDASDATDLYGRSKYLGEVEYPNSITLRTSFLGHELNSNLGLVDWLLSQTGSAKGFTKAIYTGLTAIEIENVITNYVIPRKELTGLYHVASDPISKYDLLNIVKIVYEKEVTIEAFDGIVINRSLNSERFQRATGYKAPTWESMITDMYIDFSRNTCYRKKLHGKGRG